VDGAVDGSGEVGMTALVALAVAAAVGALARGGVAHLPPARLGSLRPSTAPLPEPRQWADAVGLAIGLAVGLVVPPIGVAVVVVVLVARVRRPRRRAAQQQRAIDQAVPDVVEVAATAVAAGATVPLVVQALAEWSPAVQREAWRVAHRLVVDGARCAEALAGVADSLGDGVRPLVAVLTAALDDGVALLPSLDRLAAEARADRRRRSEAAARRLAVRLAFPVVCCTLPAFALLTVAPLLGAALGDLAP
jgi:Flp pilus assembly protein TadB